jgi:undecaprenyl-diphosphatase
MWQNLIAADEALLRLINGKGANPALDFLMAAISDFGFFKIPLFLAVVVLAGFGKFRERTLLVLLGLCVLIGDAGISKGLKEWVRRPRPADVLSDVRLVKMDSVRWSQPDLANSKGRSFPSSHTCNNVALALVVTCVYGRRWAWIWIWALLMSYSRIYTGSHFPSDVLASWGLALIYTGAILWICEKGWQWAAPRKFPQLYARHPRLIFASCPSST